MPHAELNLALAPVLLHMGFMKFCTLQYSVWHNARKPGHTLQELQQDKAADRNSSTQFAREILCTQWP